MTTKVEVVIDEESYQEAKAKLMALSALIDQMNDKFKALSQNAEVLIKQMNAFIKAMPDKL